MSSEPMALLNFLSRSDLLFGRGPVPSSPRVYVWVSLVLILFACQHDKEGTDASTTSTNDTTATASSSPGPTTGVDSESCRSSAPVSGGPCAPFGVLSAGANHTCALLFGGKLRCWGGNQFGQLGQGHTDVIGDDETPDASFPLDLGEAAIQVATGLHHTCTVTESGRIYCWGSGSVGKLGSGNTIDIGDDELAGSAGSVPIKSSAIQVVTGAQHTCALIDDGSVYCWGRGESGQLGTGSTADIGDDEALETQNPVDLGGPAVQLSSWRDHTCAVLEGGEVSCWGNGVAGQLGRGNTENIGDDETPAAGGLVDVGAPVARVATGAYHTCALTTAGEVRCWGSSGSGALGYGTADDIGDDEHPRDAGSVSLGRSAIDIAAGGATTCAILDDSSLRCWGSGDHGQLGSGTRDEIGLTDVPSDFGPIELGEAVVQVTVGNSHVCALLADDSIRCWGLAGLIGSGNTGAGVDSLCYEIGPVSVCDLAPLCCIGDMPGEMPPPPVPYQ